MIGTTNQNFSDQLLPLLRLDRTNLNAFLEEVKCSESVTSSKATAHCYFIALDGNKRPRIKDFARFIATRITDFAIPQAEVMRALEAANAQGSVAPISALNKKAIGLFTKLPKSGEGGEVLLSVLAEGFLKIPQLFSKMVLKTSPEMHVHGSDGIHVGVNDTNGNLAIYWGESKLYKNVDDGISKCFRSLAPFLLDSGGSKSSQERDLQLMRDGLSFDDPSLLEALKRHLDPDHEDFNKMEYRGLCLVGFSSDAYPDSPNSKEAYEIKAEVGTAFENHLAAISKTIRSEKIESFVIEVFCVPFPCVQEFRDAFRQEIGVSVEQK